MRTLYAFITVLFLSAAPAAFATCTPGGFFNLFYNHLANSGPAVDDCWNPSNATFTSDYVCGTTVNGYTFGYGGNISQQVTIPSGWTTKTNFQLAYELDFNDPNNSSYNQLQVSVYDLTTFTSLGTDFYNGTYSDITCTPRTVSFSGNLAGHTISVSISGSVATSGTVVRVRSIALWQW